MVRRSAIAQGKWTRGESRAHCRARRCRMALASVYILRTPLIDSRTTAPAALLEPGWQFYTRPTSLEPPGTVFRIDKEGRRFAVAEIPTEKTTGTEAFGAHQWRFERTHGCLPSSSADAQMSLRARRGIAWKLSSSRCSTSRRRSPPTWRSWQLLVEFRSHVEYQARESLLRHSRGAIGAGGAILLVRATRECTAWRGGTVAAGQR